MKKAIRSSRANPRVGIQIGFFEGLRDGYSKIYLEERKQQKQFENFVCALDFSNIYNLSNYNLSEIKNLVLAHELDFCLPSTYIKQKEVLAEFEVLIGQLQHHLLTSKVNLDRLLARMNDLAHLSCGLFIDKSDFNIQHEFFKTIKSLHDNFDILISKLYKG